MTVDLSIISCYSQAIEWWSGERLFIYRKSAEGV